MARRRAQPAKPDTLVLHLDGRIPSRQFRQAVGAFLDFVEEVTVETAGGPNAIRWIISVRPGSINLAADPEPVQRRAPVKTVLRSVSGGVRLLARRPQRPRHFTTRALRRLRALTEVVDGLHVTKAEISTAAGVVPLSGALASNLDRLLSTPVKDYGSVEGKLQTLSERGGFHFAVFDQLTDDGIRCEIPQERSAEAWRAFGKRVAVSGEVKYDRGGMPVSIRVEEIYVFPEDSELPGADDAYGVLTQHADA
jgi:hypothetical protein